MRTVAEHVGVSAMTVSNAFSRPDQLSAALRERVLAAAAELGYVGPDPTARALAGGSTGTVGLLLTESVADAFSDEMSTAFLGTVARALAPTGLGLTLLPPSDDGDVVPARDVAMDGALVYSCRADSTALRWLVKRGLPLVYVDQVPPEGVPAVLVEDREGAAAAARHLVDLGHRRVGLVTQAPVTPSDPAAGMHPVRERRLGWRDVLDPAGCVTVPVVAAAPTQEAGYEVGRGLLDRPDRPTAVLAFCDALAAGVLLAALDLGLRVPDDLSVVGFDDVPLACRLRPALTTVHQDVEAKGRAATAALLAAVGRRGESSVPADQGGRGHARPVVLPTTLVVRDSTAPPRH